MKILVNNFVSNGGALHRNKVLSVARVKARYCRTTLMFHPTRLLQRFWIRWFVLERITAHVLEVLAVALMVVNELAADHGFAVGALCLQIKLV